MKASKFILSAVLGILLVSTVATLPTHAASNEYTASYQTSASTYVSTTSMLGTATVEYQVANGIYNGATGNGSLSIQVINYVGTSSGGNSSVNLSVSSSYSNSSVKTSISGDGGTLLYVAVNQDGINQVIWSGVAKINATTSTTIAGLAYINASTTALVVLGFASTSGVETASAQLGQTANISINLPQFTFSTRSTIGATGNVQVIFPVRYRTITMRAASVNATGSITTPVASVGSSAFLQARYPDMVWEGTGTASTTFNDTTSTAAITSRTAEFFGANGTIVGYAQEFSLQSSKTINILGTTADVQTIASSTLIVSATQPIGGSSTDNAFTTMVTGQAVVIQKNSAGAISSTANIESQHGVMINGSSSTLVMLNTNGTSAYVLVNFSNNSSQSVSQTSPQSEKPTTITVSSKTYSATQVNITATGNIVFNVTESYPSVIVFKANATGIFRLNSANYWTVNGSVYVFDDPSSTYYVANGGTTSTGQTSPGHTTTGGQTQSTATGSQSSTSSTNSNAVDIAVGIVLVLVAVGAIAFGVSRRKP